MDFRHNALKNRRLSKSLDTLNHDFKKLNLRTKLISNQPALNRIESSPNVLKVDNVYNHKIKYLSNECLFSSQRILNMCEEATAMGVSIGGKLEEQGEKLNRIESRLFKLNNDLNSVERDLNFMEKSSCWHLCCLLGELLLELFCCCCRKKKIKSENSSKTDNNSFYSKTSIYSNLNRKSNKIHKIRNLSSPTIANDNKKNTTEFTVGVESSVSSSGKLDSIESIKFDDENNKIFEKIRVKARRSFQSMKSIKSLISNKFSHHSSNSERNAKVVPILNHQNSNLSLNKSLHEMEKQLNMNMRQVDACLDNLQMMVYETGLRINQHNEKICKMDKITDLSIHKTKDTELKGKKFMWK
jgi:hypothetical protein